jgi:hypothetical protein
MSEGGEPKQNTQNHLMSPMSEGGEPKQNTQNHLTSPMSEGGEPLGILFRFSSLRHR